MTLHAVNKKKIIAALLELRKNYEGSDRQFATMWGINQSAWSQLKSGKTDKLVSDDKLVSIGRKLNVQLMDAPDWKIVNTETFSFVTEQLEVCQREGAARILVEMAGIGKTTAAKEFMLKNRNVFYVDCSQCKGLRLFIKALAKCMGVSTSQSFNDMIADIKYCIIGTTKPLIILDEFGDLEYRAFMEVKGLWNATEGCCGWYAMGADGLKAKIDSGITNKRVGFAEFFRRFGSDYMTVRAKMDVVQERLFIMAHAEMIVHANMPGRKVKELMATSETTGVVYSLTRLKERIIKLKRDAA